MPTWKKVVISGSAISQLSNDLNYLAQSQTDASLSGSFSGSFVGDGSGLINIVAPGTISGSAQVTVQDTTGFGNLQSNISASFAVSSSAHTQRIAVVDVLSGSAATQREAQKSEIDGRLSAIETFTGSLDDSFVTEAELASATSSLSSSAHTQRVALSASSATYTDDKVDSLSGSSATALRAEYVAADTALSGSTATALRAEYVAADTALSASQKTYIDAKVAGLVDSAPATLDTLNELAAALNDDPNFSASIATSIGNRVLTSTFNTYSGSVATALRAEYVAADTALSSSTATALRAEYVAGDNALSSSTATALRAEYVAGDNALSSSTATALRAEYVAGDSALSASAHTQRLAISSSLATSIAGVQAGALVSGSYQVELKSDNGDLNFTDGQAFGDIHGQGAGTLDIYAPSGAAWIELNYGDSDYIYLDGRKAGIQIENDGTTLEWTFYGQGANAGVLNAPGDIVIPSNKEFNGGKVVVNTVTGSANFETLANLPTLVSGSSQVAISGTDGYSTYSASVATYTDGKVSALSGSEHSARVALSGSQKTYIDAKVAGLVDSAPATLDTLNELAAALNDDPNFSASIATSIGNRVLTSTFDTYSGSSATALRAEYVAADSALSSSSATALRAELNASSSILRTNIDDVYINAISTANSELNASSSALTAAYTSADTTLSSSAHTQREALISDLSASAHTARLTGATSASSHEQRVALIATLSASVDAHLDATISALSSSVDSHLDANISSLSSSAATALRAEYVAADSALSSSQKTYIDQKVAGLVDSAPATLDTLNELAAALNDDPNFSASIATSIGNRLLTSTFNTYSGSAAGAIRAEYTAADTALSASIATTIGGLTNDYNELLNIPAGIISSSDQLLNVATDFGSGRVSGEQIGDVAGTSTITGSFNGDGSGLTNITVDQNATVTSTFTSVTSHTVTHNFGSKNVIAFVYDENDNQILPEELTTSTANSLNVTFSTSTSGRVVVARGGHIVSGSIPFANLIALPTLVSGSSQVTVQDTDGFTELQSNISASFAVSSSAHTQREALVSALSASVDAHLDANISALSASVDAHLDANISALSASVDAHLDANITDLSSSAHIARANLASSLVVSGSTGNDIVNLKTDSLSIIGTASEIETTVTNNQIAIGIVTNPTLSGNVVVTGNLTVQGDTFENQVTNLNVEDRFILLNSGSNSGDVGIIFGGSDGVTNEGSGIFWDSPSNVFGFAQGIGTSDTSATHTAKLGAITTSTSDPSTTPTFQGIGSIHVNTNTEEVFIYTGA
jgi:hypothetical protein